MKRKCFLPFALAAIALSFVLSIAAADKSMVIAKAQVPAWTKADLDFFMHGSMSTEIVPERVLRAFIATYPDLYPSSDLSHFGLLPDRNFGWPIGFSRKEVPHFGGLSSIGINCASCHLGEVTSGKLHYRILGVTSHFDAEAFFGSILVSGFRTTDPANMKKFLLAYLDAEGSKSDKAHREFEAVWKAREDEIEAAIKRDPLATNNIPAGTLHMIEARDLKLDPADISAINLAETSKGMLRVFHNMRAALHVPDVIPDKAPPASGPGRNDAFGLLSGVLFGEPQPYAPVKYGLVWNLRQRHWVHWDGNTQSPIGRNLLAALGLGAPLTGKQAKLEFALVKRHTDLSQDIRAPRYPFDIDQSKARRGAAHFETKCASCHNGKESDARLYEVSQIGTQSLRPTLFTQKQADLFNKFLAGIETPGYRPATEPGIRSTGKIWAASLDGVWARSPYLHNGSIRTMEELLTRPTDRAKSFHRGSREFDPKSMGYTDEGSYVLECSQPQNSNAGHDFGTDLSLDQKRELVEYLKTL